MMLLVARARGSSDHQTETQADEYMDVECQLELLNVCVHRLSSISDDPSVSLDDHSP